MNLDGYVGVNERLRSALEKWPDLRIVEEPVEVREDWPGGPVIICKVLVYRTVDDVLPTIGSVIEAVPGRTPYTKGSELMNGYTSAVGRALGYMGFGIGNSIASQEEVRTARQVSDHVEAARPTATSTNGPSDKQLRLLKSLGYAGPAPATVRDASALIEQIKNDGGRLHADSDQSF